MRTRITVSMLLLASLLLVAGCGGGEGSEASSEAPDSAPEETTAAPTAEPEAAQTPTLTIVKANGERVEVEVEVADTKAEQARGLMERTGDKSNQNVRIQGVTSTGNAQS